MKIIPDKYGFYYVYADDECVLVNEETRTVTAFIVTPNIEKNGFIEMKKEDAPSWDEDPGKESLSADEAWKIIESSNISKENKQLLKDYIYKEG